MSDVIPAWVSGWIGLPWADRGRGPQAYDCWGLVRAVLAEQFALEVPDFSQKYGRSRSASAASVIDAERLDWQRVATNQRAGDVVLLRSKNRPVHVGILVSADWVLHVDAGNESLLESLDSPRFKGHVEGIYRHPDLCRLPVLAVPNPLQPEKIERFYANEGQTLAEIVGNAAQTTLITINGIEIDRAWWPQIRPKAGAIIQISRRFQGRNGGKIVQVIAIIAAVVVSVLGAPQFAGVAYSGVMLVGSFFLKKNKPVTPTSDSFNRRQSLTGTQNNALQWGSVPCVFGRMKFFPPLAAVPYTETVGTEQYLRILLMLGYGPLEIEDIRIGATPLSSFQDVEFEVGAAPNLYSNDINEEQLGVTLENPNDNGQRTLSGMASELSLDFVFPQGLFAINNDGNTVPQTNEYAIEFRLAGSTVWNNLSNVDGLQFSSPVIGYNPATAGMRARGAERSVLFVGLRWKVPYGQYEVRVRLLSRSNLGAGATHVYTATWTVARTILYRTPSTVPNTVLLALRIRASDQLNGTLDRVSVQVRRQLPVFNGSAWVNQYTSNPAWIYAYILAGNATERPIDRASKLDLPALQSWATWCSDNDFLFNAVIDSRSTVFDLAQTVATAGRASWSVKNGKYGVVRDLPASVPVQLFSSRNLKRLSSSLDLSSAPQALRVQWVNPEADWQQDELLVFDAGFDASTAQIYETLQLRGITSARQAWRMARYVLASRRLRKEVVAVEVDFEQLVCQRGDLVRVSHDIMATSVCACRVTSVQTNSAGKVSAFTVDEHLDLASISQPVARLRLANQPAEPVVLCNVTLTESIEGQQFLAPSQPVSGLQTGDLVVIGAASNDTRLMRVLSIEPLADLAARLNLVDAALDIFNADTNPPAQFVSAIAGASIDISGIICCPPVVVNSEGRITDRFETTGGQQYGIRMQLRTEIN